MNDPVLANSIWESGLSKLFSDIRIRGKAAVGLNSNIRFYRLVCFSISLTQCREVIISFKFTKAFPGTLCFNLCNLVREWKTPLISLNSGPKIFIY